MMTTPALWILIGTLGLCLGSYVSTAALRWSQGRPSSAGRSSCDHCGVRLNFARTTPVFAFVAQRGACFSCGGPIDRVHPLGELTGAAVLIMAFAVAPPPEAALLSLVGLLLLADAIVDAKVRRLPDVLAAGIGGACALLSLTHSWQAIQLGAVSAAAAFVCLDGLRRSYLKWRGEPGLGFGDVKLVTAIAFWTGPNTSYVLVLAAILGLAGVALGRGSKGRLAFGPYIAAAAWIVGVGLEAHLWPTLI